MTPKDRMQCYDKVRHDSASSSFIPPCQQMLDI